jgi:type I restriction enzyme S subunit
VSFPPYPSYRDSGIDWLRKIPAHWDVSSLKRHFDVRLGKMLQTDPKTPSDLLLPYLRAANIHWGVPNFDDVKEMWFSDNEIEELRLEPGDLLISEGGDVGRSAIWSINYPSCLIQNSVNRVRPKNNYSTGFLIYWMRYLKENGFIDIVCNKSTIAHFTAEKVGAVEVAFPTPLEQSAIAAFLDRETARIDALIEEQERLIALLKEKRQAVISHAVTKGLDPNAPMKDSGVEWLGEVPAHWRVCRLKHLGDFAAGAGFPHEEQGIEGEELSFHKVNALAQADADGYLMPSENTVSIDTAQRLRAFVFPQNSIVFAKIGAAMLLRRFRRLRQAACLDNNMMGFVTDHQYDVDFMLNLMSQVRFEMIANPGTVPSLNEGQIANVVVAVPDRLEQMEISKYLGAFTRKLAGLEAEAEAAITLLQERRSALVSSAVTGKIDVRGRDAAGAETT